MIDQGEELGQQAKVFDRLYGSMPWPKPTEKQHFRVKVFKSGNSVALRLPAALALKAGMEMDLTVENGDRFSLEPAVRSSRKFNIAKVAGSAIGLKPIAKEDRAFEERQLIWPDPDGRS